MAHILLSGGTGFLGSQILDALLVQGHEVTLLKRVDSDVSRIAHSLKLINYYDVDDVSLDSVFKESKMDLVIHTACNYGRNNESASKILETNLVFGLELLEFSANYGVSAFINTDSFLPSGTNYYSLSKNQFYQWLKSYSGTIKRVNVKIDYMYGEGEGGSTFLSYLLRGFKERFKRIRLTGGDQLRDFIHVSDVVSAYMSIVSNINALADFGEFEVGSWLSTTVRDFVETVESRFTQEFGPTDTTLGFGDLPYRLGELDFIGLDPVGIKNLGWAPDVDLCEGIDRVIGSMSIK